MSGERDVEGELEAAAERATEDVDDAPREPANEASARAAGKRKARGKKRRTKDLAPSEELAREEDAADEPPQVAASFYLGAAVAVVAGAIVGFAILSPTETPYAIVVTGLAAFFAGAGHPRPDRGLRFFMAIAALGLAGLATTTSPWAIVAAVGGGLGLGGSIHRVGREGPEGAPS